MKHIPILFSTDMVQAIIDGRKTQTRRVMKNPEVSMQNCPYGQPGDVLWVRESFGYTNACELRYKANAEQPKYDKPHTGWKPSIHMPKTACRIWLQVVSVRAERLHDISEDDAIAEGVKLHEKGVVYLNYQDQKWGLTQFIYNCRTAKESFSSLWKMINGFRDEPYAWLKNPWVWRIEFKRIDKPENFI